MTHESNKEHGLTRKSNKEHGLTHESNKEHWLTHESNKEHGLILESEHGVTYTPDQLGDTLIKPCVITYFISWVDN